MTPQGKAIKQAAIDFGNDQTLPFTPCKKGYIPIVDGIRKVACPLHNKAREKRLLKEKGQIRPGEVSVSKLFWSNDKDNQSPLGKRNEESSSTVTKPAKKKTVKM